MELNIRDKKVLITASTEGIGKGIAKALAKEGCKIIISSRHEDKVGKTVEELRKINPSIWGTTSDITDMKSIENLSSFSKKILGNIDVLIVNTGNPPSEPSYFEETKIEDWEYAIRLYLIGAIKLVKEFLPEMIRNHWGRIIFLSSWTVKEPQSIFALADVSRSSLIQLSKILGRDYGKFGITTNTILMGSFETEGAKKTIRNLANKKGEKFEDLWQQLVISPIPVGKIGNPEKDLSPLIIFLISDFSWYINGTSILIDGGLTNAV